MTEHDPRFDARGLAVSGASRVALGFYEDALSRLWLQRGDPLALARAAQAIAPGFVAAHQLEASLLLASRDARDFARASGVLARMDAIPQNGRERRHSGALHAAAAGDYARAARIYDELLEKHPWDIVALSQAQVYDYYLGSPASQCARTNRAVRIWSRELPGFHAVLSMHAFALEECGDYGAAEDAALQAIELEPRDARAHHALAHVHEMQGEAREGIRWLGARSAQWHDAGATATHLWWHIALFQQQLGRPDLALAVYDRRIEGKTGLSALVDASALLWRLGLEGVEVQERFVPLAAAWACYADDAHCAFNDLHAMMAFAGARRWNLCKRLVSAQERRLRGAWTTNHDMTRLVGLPACRAVESFAKGDYGRTEALLRALPPVAHRIGGSHAQRDILLLTRAAARTEARKVLLLESAA
jgi:tetratricopeptide (TPR) repeat protein